MKYYPVMPGLCHKPWNKDPIIKQPVWLMESKARFFFVAQMWLFFHGVDDFEGRPFPIQTLQHFQETVWPGRLNKDLGYE